MISRFFGLRKILSAILLASTLGIVFQPRAVRAQTALVLWHSWKSSDAAVLDKWIAAYRESSDVLIEAEYVPFFEMITRYTNPPNNKRPDMVIGPSDWAGQLINNRLLTQLDTLISSDFKAQIADKAWQLASYDGRAIAVPVVVEGLGLFYNHDLAPEPPATFEALRDSSKFALPVTFYQSAGILFALGGQLIDAGGNPLIGQSDTLQKYLAIVKDLALRAKTLQIDASGGAFERAEAPFFIGGNWDLPWYQSLLRERLRYVPLPPVQGQPWRPFVRAQQIYITLGGQRIDASLNFARFVTDVEAQAEGAEAGFLAVNPKVSDPTIGAVNAVVLKDGMPISNRPEMALYWHVMDDAVNAVANGADPEEVAKTTVNQLTKAVENFRNPPTPTPGQ